MKRIVIFLGLAGVILAQDRGRITVPFSDAGRPRAVTGNMLQGCFAVEGYDGKDVIIEQQGAPENTPRHVPKSAEGLKRIEPAGAGLTVEEENNVVHIRSSWGRSGDLVVRVPFNTALKLKCINGGDLKVQRVSGDLELANVNGAVTATNVSGSVVANSTNGRVLVTMDKVTPDKPMAFSTLNGDIDITFPGDTRGAVKMKSENGDIYSDFDIKLNASSSAPVVEDGRAKGGKYRVKVDHTTAGTINGGGPDLSFKTFNGSIYIRKKK